MCGWVPTVRSKGRVWPALRSKNYVESNLASICASNYTEVSAALLLIHSPWSVYIIVDRPRWFQ